MTSLLPPDWPVESDWSERLMPVFRSEQFHQLSQFMATERATQTVFPRAEDTFRAYALTPFAKTRVVVLGQDPYHQPGQAHGLAFSVPNGARWPPSLRNIFRELTDDTGAVRPPLHGDLSDWAGQGILLLNTVLTVRRSSAGSHQRRGWEALTEATIRCLAQDSQPRLFVLWGKAAARVRDIIRAPHQVLTAPHPSPLSAHRGFFGSRPFSRINQFLNEQGWAPVRWA